MQKRMLLNKVLTPNTWLELTYQAFYYHFRKWSADDSFQYVFKASIVAIMFHLNISEINLDGTHTIAKKGGEEVAYQYRKKAEPIDQSYSHPEHCVLPSGQG